MRDVQIDRKYLGILITAENYKEITKDPDKKRFHEKHLKAYKAGHDFFHHGWDVDEVKKTRTPKIHKVQQEFTISFLNEKDERVYKKASSQRMAQTLLN